MEMWITKNMVRSCSMYLPANAGSIGIHHTVLQWLFSEYIQAFPQIHAFSPSCFNLTTWNIWFGWDATISRHRKTQSSFKALRSGRTWTALFHQSAPIGNIWGDCVPSNHHFFRRLFVNSCFHHHVRYPATLKARFQLLGRCPTYLLTIHGL